MGHYTISLVGLNNGHSASLPVRSILCCIPLSAAVQVLSFEYPWPLPGLPSSLPTSLLPVRHNMNTLVSREWKVVKVPLSKDTPKFNEVDSLNQKTITQ